MRTILIVDDEPAARYGLRRALEAKYRIAEADSAEAARVEEQNNKAVQDLKSASERTVLDNAEEVYPEPPWW